jgi:hypothetical protein
VLLSGVVLAQPGARDPLPAVPAAPAPATGPAPADLRVGALATITPQDMLKNGTDFRKAMSQVAARIEQQLDEARKDKDLIRVNCLTDKAIQARANLNVAEKSFAAMQEAIRRNSEGAAFDQYSRLTILNQNVMVLVAEANACIGQDLSFVGATRVDVKVEGVPTGDPTKPGDEEDPIPEVTRPPFASPYL